MVHYEACYLSISPQSYEVVLLPVGPTRAADHFVVAVPLPHPSILPSRGCQSAKLSVLVHGLAQPVDARVATDRLVRRIHHDDLKELVRGILSHPVRVENAQATAISPRTFLSQGTETALSLDL